MTRGDGETRYVGFSVSRLTDAFGSHRGYIIIFQDLTRWRRMQEELRIKDRMVGRRRARGRPRARDRQPARRHLGLRPDALRLASTATPRSAS